MAQYTILVLVLCIVLLCIMYLKTWFLFLKVSLRNCVINTSICRVLSCINTRKMLVLCIVLYYAI